MTPTYPDGLPLGLHSGRTYQLISPLQRTELSSGRARQRRRFTDVPEGAQISWLFNSVQSRTFEAWWRDALIDGSLWFLCPLETTLGLDDYDCRFTGVYQGPSRVGPDLWSITAELELRVRAVLPKDWGLTPEFVLYASIFDRAMNEEWPAYEFSYPTYAAALADIRNLRAGTRVSVKVDETQGGQHSYYEVVRADSPSLTLDFLAKQYAVGSSTDALQLVVTYAN